MRSFAPLFAHRNSTQVADHVPHAFPDPSPSWHRRGAPNTDVGSCGTFEGKAQWRAIWAGDSGCGDADDCRTRHGRFAAHQAFGQLSQ